MKHTQILAAATALLFVATAAQAQHRQDDHHDRADQPAHVSPQVRPRPRDGNPGHGAAEVQRWTLEQARAGQARGEEMKNQPRNAQSGKQQHELQMRQHDVQVRQREQTTQLERARQRKGPDRLLQARRRTEVKRAHLPGGHRPRI